ncbi:hypothetical protein [Lutibaculum baratangense]|uniref:Uncharacterized protein n=1 Tax=Lutibaculum baratangense AMV1 TaxID=631454 RepID=V4TIB3_9HYPH|nr:hypothetical protein [Lutibaculum baratangense]ESR25743.1 hypothetical protein N177_1576 [Lutibaculum baratangense AMV1]
MLVALLAAFLLVGPPSVLWSFSNPALVPLYYGALNLWFGYLFWRHRKPQLTVVMAYLLSGTFLFKFLIDPLGVSALPPLPAQPQSALAGAPHEQRAIPGPHGSRWTDWMAPDPARAVPLDVKGAATDRGPLKVW